MDRQSATPILVLGTARSGTTWLMNILATHPAIASPHHIVHWGSIESAIYFHQQFAGDLSDDGAFVSFVEQFAASDLFRALGGDKARVYERRRTSFYDMILDLFEDHAQAQGARYWATKLDPMYFYRPEALAEFLGAVGRRGVAPRFLAISRSSRAVMRSYLAMEGKTAIHRLGAPMRLTAGLLEALRISVHQQGIERLIDEQSGLHLHYDDLRRATATTLEQLADWLGVDVGRFATDAYPPNTSKRRTRSKSPLDRALVEGCTRVVVPAFHRMPGVASLLLRGRDRLRGRVNPMYWRLLRLETMPERLSQDLLDTGQENLRDVIFEGPSKRCAQ